MLASCEQHHLARAMPRLIIDRREHQLLRMMPHAESETLAAGDVLCQNESGSGWLAERKTAGDLARSLKDGRWEDQCDRILNSGLQAVLIIEGSLRDADFPYEPLMAACVSAAARGGTLLFRTWDVEETVHLIGQLAKKVEVPCCKPISTLGTSKRKKDTLAENIWVRQLACIPTFSEGVARALLAHFGTLMDLQRALRAPRNFPTVQIAPTLVLGKARLAKLVEVLSPPD